MILRTAFHGSAIFCQFVNNILSPRDSRFSLNKNHSKGEIASKILQRNCPNQLLQRYLRCFVAKKPFCWLVGQSVSWSVHSSINRLSKNANLNEFKLRQYNSGLFENIDQCTWPCYEPCWLVHHSVRLFSDPPLSG